VYLPIGTLEGYLPESIGAWVNITGFWVYDNLLHGTLPLSMAAWQQLSQFNVMSNQLEGAVPQLPFLATTCTENANMDCAGNDMFGFAFVLDTAAECCAKCQATLGCNAWTWNAKTNRYCYVKTGCPNPSSSGGIVAGWRQTDTGCILLDHAQNGTNSFNCPWTPGVTTSCQKNTAPTGTWTLVPITSTDCVSPCTGASANLAVDQCLAWIDLFKATGGDVWEHCRESKLDPCSCTSGGTVTCSSDGTAVTGIYLGGSNLRGTLPSSIGAFSSLAQFRVEGNYLQGTIPSSLSSWAAIEIIDVSANQLRGTTGTFGKLKTIHFLAIDINEFWGPFPDMTKLTGCHLYAVSGISSTNKFTCPLPPSALQYCKSFNGTNWVPVTAADCIPNRCTGSASVNLEPVQCDAWIDFYDATGGNSTWTVCTGTRLDPCSCLGWNGMTPVCNSGGTTVVTIALGEGNYHGTLPSSIDAWADIQTFNVQGGGGSLLTGTIPSSIGAAWKSITSFQVYQNQFTGLLPALAFEQMTNGCYLFDPANGGKNAFACPLPGGASHNCLKRVVEAGEWLNVTDDECTDTNCTGSSISLAPAQCNAWIDLYEATGGALWTYCAELKTDPCKCTGHKGEYDVCNSDGTAVQAM
jgi:hypothetical protein